VTILYFVLLVGVLIFIHELGHFLFAKLFDVHVKKFSLGFGPRAVGFKFRETDYCVSYFPLGGFVKMLGDDPNDEILPEDQGRAFFQKPLWQRFIVVFAGPAFNVIFPTIIYFFFFITHTELPPAEIGKVFDHGPAAMAGIKAGDTIVAAKGKKIRYWEQLRRIVGDNAGQPVSLTIERKKKRFDRVVTPTLHSRRNEIGAVKTFGLIGISPFVELPQIGISDPGSPASQADLKTGDLIVSVNGNQVFRWADLEKVLKKNRGETLRVSYLRPSSSLSSFFNLHYLSPRQTQVSPEPVHEAGRVRYNIGIHSAEFFVTRVQPDSVAYQIGLRPGDRVVEFDGTAVVNWEMIELELQSHPEKTHQISWQDHQGDYHKSPLHLKKTLFIDDFRQEQVRYVFGAQNELLWRAADPVPIDHRLSYAASEAVRKTSEVISVMVMSIVEIFRGKISGSTIGGPVMLAFTAKVAAEKGWDYFLWMMAIISINLGLINLLPIPILDGGHILFFLIEAVRRKPISLRTREYAAYLGLVLLISLMIFALKNDIVRYWFQS